MNIPFQTARRVSVSTWALHPLIGTVAPGRPGDPDARLMAPRDGELDLLDVPAMLAKNGYSTMELCHFHLPETSDAYLERLRGAIEDAGIELWSLLIDDGDIVHPEFGDRDREWIEGWIDIAAALGARCARVIAGKQPPTIESLHRASEQMAGLAVYAYVRGVRLLTENWFPLLSQPDIVVELLTGLRGSVGLNFDFGNWGDPDKYLRLEQIARFAEGCHAKCDFKDGVPQIDDYDRCLKITRDASFAGPYTLVHGEPADVWGSLNRQRELVAPYL